MPEQPHHNPQEINIRDLIIEDPAPIPLSWEQEMDETFGDGVLEKAVSGLEEQVRTDLTSDPAWAGYRFADLRIVDPTRAASLQESLSPKERTSIVDALEERVRTNLTGNNPAGAGDWLACLRIVDPTKAVTLQESLSPQERTSIVDVMEERVRTDLTGDPAWAGERLAYLRIVDPTKTATLQESLSPKEHTSIVDALEETVRTDLTENDTAVAGWRLADLRIIQAHDIIWKRDGLHIIDTAPTPEDDRIEPQPELLRT